MQKYTHTKNDINQDYMILIKFRTVFVLSLMQKFRYTVPIYRDAIIVYEIYSIISIHVRFEKVFTLF